MATQKKSNCVSLFASVIETDNKVVRIDGLPIREVAEKALNVASFFRHFSFEVLQTLGLDIASARCIVVFSTERAGRERQSGRLNFREVGKTSSVFRKVRLRLPYTSASSVPVCKLCVRESSLSFTFRTMGASQLYI